VKIVFLNVWHGKCAKDLAAFLQVQAKDTHVFCFQEASVEARELFRHILTDFKVAYTDKFVTQDDTFSQAMYVRRDLQILSSATIAEQEPACGVGQYAQVRVDGRDINICNFHGMSRPADKKVDSPARLKQTNLLLKFFEGKPGTVIGGDFNILPQTQSIKLFRQNGYQDLIKDFGITNTRNKLVWDRFPDSKQYFSDYAFASADVKVEGFDVPDCLISDHLPLILRVT